MIVIQKDVTFIDALENEVCQPKRQSDDPFRIKQDKMILCVHVGLYPSGVKGKALSLEMYHKNVTETLCGDNVDVTVEGSTKDNM